MQPAFWAGLGVWLVFAVAPARRLLRAARPGFADPTAGLPYQATLGSGKRSGHEDRYLPQVGRWGGLQAGERGAPGLILIARLGYDCRPRRIKSQF